MKKLFLILFVLFNIILSLNANDKIIKKIKDYYYKVSEEAKDPLDHGLIQTEIIMNKNNIPYSVVGDVKIKYNFYYYLKYKDGDYSEHYTLAKITIYQENMRYNKFYKEYLFDEEGNLIFFFHSIAIAEENTVNDEKRFYLNKGKIIKHIVKFSSEHSKQDLKKIESSINSESEKLKEMYYNIINMPWGYFDF